MRYQYVVILKKDGERRTDLLSVLLCFGSAVIFALSQLKAAHPNYYLYVFPVLLAAGLVFNMVRRAARRRQVRFKYLILLAALGWFGMPAFAWIGLLFLALAFLEHQTKRPLEIGFDHDQVVINTLVRRRHAWSAFSNVLLKDGLLTLDFKNNRLLQREVVEDDDEENADEEEFNAYCRDRLITVNGK